MICINQSELQRKQTNFRLNRLHVIKYIIVATVQKGHNTNEDNNVIGKQINMIARPLQLIKQYLTFSVCTVGFENLIGIKSAKLDWLIAVKI